MKKTLILGLCAWLLAVGKISAVDVLTVGNVTIPKGGQATMEIGCSLTQTYVGGQWDVVMPDDGKVTPIMSGGKPVATLGFTGTDHSISSSQLKDAQKNLLQKYRFLFTSMSKAELPTSGVLMRIVLNASADAEVGTEYNVKLANIELGTANSEKSNIGDVTFKITIGESSETVTLNETSATPPAASSGPVNVTVNRTIYANEWSTICLPFAMTEAQVKAAFGDDVQLAEFMEYEVCDGGQQIKVTFDDALLAEDGFMANHPYIIKVSSKIEAFTVDGVTITPDEDHVVAEYDNGKTGSRRHVYGTFKGTYHAGTTVPNNCLFLEGNKFWYSIGITSMMAFRGYFVFEDVLEDADGARVSFSFDDTTAISSVGVDGKDASVYTLSGQRLAAPRKGINIVGGKKVIIR